MALDNVLHGNLAEKPILPDGGEYAMIAMRYKGAEFAFCMRPEHMDCALFPAIEALRECVMEKASKEETA